ncbi:MAG: hypothetical protein BWY74_03281 [Firmicutes bacterium ADurb.Bin419]|nr:MAG: hypothetical protein BWY74_03281 [Firmicutes bacterium ADurb.Bin419]
MENQENTALKVDAKLALDLVAVAETLPRGSFVKIAEVCNCSDEYVRRFFKGEYFITEENIKILDAANKILDKELAIEEKAKKKVTEILNKARG